jgi:hypothetical protein
MDIRVRYPLELLVGMSVSRANNGAPVTGLGVENFRIASQIGRPSDFAVEQVTEWSSEPADKGPSGCYQLSIGWNPTADLVVLAGQPHNPPARGRPFVPGWRYVLGIQVRTFDQHLPPRAVDRGQTIVEVVSTGT